MKIKKTVCDANFPYSQQHKQILSGTDYFNVSALVITNNRDSTEPLINNEVGKIFHT